MKITIDIIATTHIDRHNEKMSKSALDDGAKQIKERFIPKLVEHDINRHIGVALYGEVFQLKDGEYALAVVSGIFEDEDEKEAFETGQTNNVWKNYKKYLNIEELLKIIKKDNQTKDRVFNFAESQSNIANLLEDHLDSTQVLPNGTVYKVKRYIASVGDLIIKVYIDHKPPHFHVESKPRGINARFCINTLELINSKQGSITQKDIKKIQHFFKTNPNNLKKLKSEHKRMNIIKDF